jgi:DNA-binding beta-propeller fold protein YncE
MIQSVTWKPVALGAAGVVALVAWAGPVSGSPPPAAARMVQSRGLGACTTKVAVEPVLNDAREAMTSISGDPFGVAVSRDGGYSFVSGFGPGRASRSGASVAVLSDRRFPPKLVRTVPLGVPAAAADALTHDGRYLLVATGSGAAVVDVARAESGSAHALLGFLTSPGPAGAGPPRSPGRPAAPGAAILPGALGSAIEVTTSPDDRYAFVSLEYQDEIAVFDLHAALASRLRRSGYVGAITLGEAVVGMAVSPDGRRLYATSELAAGARARVGANGLPSGEGTVSVIDLHKAESTPSASVLATAPAGCGTVRVAVSPNGRVVWVTARESDALLAFSAARLVSDPNAALLAQVRVGEAPVGLAVVDHGSRIVVADSNRFNAPGATSGLTVVVAADALAGKPALLGSAPAGLFPRELSLEPNGSTLLVTDFESGQLEALDLRHLR